MKRVLVTGAAGFVGYQTLAPLLRKGYEVHAVSRVAPRNGRSDVQWHTADLLDSRQPAKLVQDLKPTHLLHSAWFLKPGEFYESPMNFDWVQSSFDLVRIFREAGGRRCLMVGTAYEYDLRFGFCSEDRTPCHPLTTYGRCKHALQQLVAAYSDATDDLTCVWGRLFFLYGPRENRNRLVGSVINALLTEQPARCSTGEQIRDYMHVADAGDALVEALDSSVEGPINIASGEPVAIRTIVDLLVEALGRPDLVRRGEVPTNPDSPPLIVADVTRITRELGWKPKFSLTNGLHDAISWWSSNPQSN